MNNKLKCEVNVETNRKGLYVIEYYFAEMPVWIPHIVKDLQKTKEVKNKKVTILVGSHTVVVSDLDLRSKKYNKYSIGFRTQFLYLVDAVYRLLSIHVT